MRRLPLVLALAVGLAGAASPAFAQRAHIVWSDDDRRVVATTDGPVQLTDDDADVASLGDGGSLIIDEHRRGEPSRHVEIRRAGAGLSRSFTVNGERRGDDAAERAWLGRILQELVRVHGFNARPRAERILRTEGPDGLLREVRRIRSDGAKRIYLLVLTENAPLTPAQAAAAARIVGTEMHSDGDRRAVLLALLPSAERDPAALAALLDAARAMSSDGDKSSVLVAAVRAPALSADSAEAAWFRAVNTVSSDGDRSRALLAVLR